MRDSDKQNHINNIEDQLSKMASRERASQLRDHAKKQLQVFYNYIKSKKPGMSGEDLSIIFNSNKNRGGTNEVCGAATTTLFKEVSQLAKASNQNIAFHINSQASSLESRSGILFLFSGKENDEEYSKAVKALSDYTLFMNMVDLLERDPPHPVKGLYSAAESIKPDVAYQTAMNGRLNNDLRSLGSPSVTNSRGRNPSPVPAPAPQPSSSTSTPASNISYTTQTPPPSSQVPDKIIVNVIERLPDGTVKVTRLAGDDAKKFLQKMETGDNGKSCVQDTEDLNGKEVMHLTPSGGDVARTFLQGVSSPVVSSTKVNKQQDGITPEALIKYTLANMGSDPIDPNFLENSKQKLIKEAHSKGKKKAADNIPIIENRIKIVKAIQTGDSTNSYKMFQGKDGNLYLYDSKEIADTNADDVFNKLFTTQHKHNLGPISNYSTQTVQMINHIIGDQTLKILAPKVLTNLEGMLKEAQKSALDFTTPALLQLSRKNLNSLHDFMNQKNGGNFQLFCTRDNNVIVYDKTTFPSTDINTLESELNNKVTKGERFSLGPASQYSNEIKPGIVKGGVKLLGDGVKKFCIEVLKPTYPDLKDNIQEAMKDFVENEGKNIHYSLVQNTTGICYLVPTSKIPSEGFASDQAIDVLEGAGKAAKLSTKSILKSVSSNGKPQVLPADVCKKVAASVRATLNQSIT